MPEKESPYRHRARLDVTFRFAPVTIGWRASTTRATVLLRRRVTVFRQPGFQRYGFRAQTQNPSVHHINRPSVRCGPSKLGWAAICVQDFDAPCVLQFAWISALCCALHRSTSLVIHRSGSYFKTLFFRSFLRNENVATSGAGFEKCGRDSEERIPLRLERGRGGPYAHASVRGEDIKTPVLIKKTVVTRARSLQCAYGPCDPPSSFFFRFIHASTPKRQRANEKVDILFPSFERIKKIGYDPSAGSPTETLLRLLLPLKDQVRTCFSFVVD